MCYTITQHKKCSCKKSYRLSYTTSGKLLNHMLSHCSSYKGDNNPFNDSNKKEYIICANLHYLINTPDLPRLTTISDKNRSMVAAASTIKTREQRAFLRNRIPVKSMKGIKLVKVMIDGDKDTDIDMTRKESRKGKTYSSMLKKDVLYNSNNYYRVPFGSLKMRQRRHRMKDIAKKLLAACVDRKEYHNSNKDEEYLQLNQSLAIDILNLIDGVKEYLESQIKLRFDAVLDMAMEPVAGDKEGLIGELDMQKKSHALALALLSETTSAGYSRMKKALGKVNNESTNIPSYYKITKETRPPISPFSIDKMKPLGEIDPQYMQEPLIDEEEEQANETQAVMVGKFKTEQEELESVLRSTSEAGATLEGARIDGGYGKYVSLMVETNVKKGRDIGEGEDIIVIDSIDGAEHLKSKKKITSVISFSSSLFSSAWIQEGSLTAGTSVNILTWQQLRGTESLQTMIPSVHDYFKQKYQLRIKEKNRDVIDHKYWFYDLHDGKMLYLLTQHSLWNRRHHPFLLCTCQRGEGVLANRTHVCRVIHSHSKQVQLYDRSLDRWNKKRRQLEVMKSKKSYTVKDHNSWVDEKNEGCSHFGIHPDLLPRDGIRFDTFHLKCAVTRRLMTYLRRFILNQSDKLIEDFSSKVLRTFWNDYHIYVWKNKKNFASFLGNEIALFVAHSEKIRTFMEENLILNDNIKDIIEGLSLWVSIFKFLAISHLREWSEREYVNKIEIFEENLMKFYDVGSRTFLSKDGKVGCDETFYLHTLRYYIPQVVRTTYERHHCGIGIFSMQGFERRNKESKSCMKRFTNHRGNILVNNLRRIWDVYSNT